MPFLEIHHLQIAIPSGGEETGREFYGNVLGLSEVKKPAHLPSRGGVWFEQGEVRLHLGVDPDFVPARKAHPGFLVEDLSAVLERCRATGVDVLVDQPLAGFERRYVYDPFGNRLELMERE